MLLIINKKPKRWKKNYTRSEEATALATAKCNIENRLEYMCFALKNFEIYMHERKM